MGLLYLPFKEVCVLWFPSASFAFTVSWSSRAGIHQHDTHVLFLSLVWVTSRICSPFVSSLMFLHIGLACSRYFFIIFLRGAKWAGKGTGNKNESQEACVACRALIFPLTPVPSLVPQFPQVSLYSPCPF